ncbi:hypothetical protein V1478_007589 [Vespula squamosa]|uniref:Uncharacterized protein n=1 Tax=Vespula squamosa TaxID=30214 RepID=A0ABD2B3S0_VESSQ
MCMMDLNVGMNTIIWNFEMEGSKIFRCFTYLIFNNLNDTWNLHSVLYLGSQTSPFSPIM